MITEEDIGLTCKSEMGKLGQTLREAGTVSEESWAGVSGKQCCKVRGNFPWGSLEWLKKVGKKLLRQASKEITKRKLSKKHQLLWPQSSPKHRKEFAW